MSQNTGTIDRRRRVHAPVTTMNGSSSVMSVVLGEDEEVEWRWTHYADGQSVVSGYEIIKTKKEEEGFDIKQAISDWLWAGDEGERR
jgi:hypothetical protein